MQNTYEIELPCGARAIVDNADRDLVSGFPWKLHSNGYVYADRARLRVALHRLIAGAGDEERVDHKNEDPLDNRTGNLRIATASQNGANRGPDRRRAGRTSKYKGVSWSNSKKRWVVYVHKDGKTRYVGRSTDEKEAACMYDRAAVEAWGEFARLNNAGGR